MQQNVTNKDPEKLFKSDIKHDFVIFLLNFSETIVFFLAFDKWKIFINSNNYSGICVGKEMVER